eukprot:218093_1
MAHTAEVFSLQVFHIKMLSQIKQTKKKDFSYNKRSTTNSKCSTKCVLISVTFFWFLFILYLLAKFKQGPIEEALTLINPLENKDILLQNIHEPINSQSFIPNHNPLLFWGDHNFNTDLYLNKLSNEFNNNGNIFDKCKAIMTSKHPRRADIWSQAYQEWYLYHNFFYGKTNGIYLDIGAHKPLHLSNSAFFDQCLGWNGICVEPTQTSQLFKDIRSCNIAQKCVWSETKTLVMIFRSDGDASLIIDKKEQDRIRREVPDRVKDLFECEAISANDLLNNYKVRNKYNEEININFVDGNNEKIEIDFISLDVEGAEVEFLRCFPFDKYDVKVWSIEINKNEGLIDELMLKYGFIKFGYLSYLRSRLDAIYVKMPMTVKLPWINKEDEENWSKYPRCKSN